MPYRLLAGIVVRALLVAAFLNGCAADIGYLWKQGGYLLRYGTGARNIDEVLSDTGTPEETRRFLSTVRAIRGFALERIGLKENGNYGTYKEIDRTYMVDVVQACDAVSLTPYTWDYPFMGKLPYKGFYERVDAEAEAQRLRERGYDVIVRTSDAFSTLGFLTDPVYSFMSRYTVPDLASLIIHEQTHATLFINGQPRFNEGLAGFVGETGGLEFARETLGADSREYLQALMERADSQLFLSSIRGLRQSLDTVYAGNASRGVKLEQKAAAVSAFVLRYDTEILPRYKTGSYPAARDLPINNAYVSLFDLYTGDDALFRSYYEERCGSDLAVFVIKMMELSKKGGDMTESMKKELGDAGGEGG
jgi:predicted aminopeptidase